MSRLLRKLEKIGRDPAVTAKAAGLRYARGAAVVTCTRGGSERDE